MTCWARYRNANVTAVNRGVRHKLLQMPPKTAHLNAVIAHLFSDKGVQ